MAPADVIILSTEDDPEDTLVPRLIAAHADRERIHIVTAVRTDKHLERTGPERQFSLQRDLRMLERELRKRPNVALIVVDPISDFLHGTDTNDNVQVRTVLRPLAQLAQRHNVAVIAINHLNKNEKVSPMYRSLGSIAFNAMSRGAWLFIKDANQPDRRLMLPAGNNYGDDDTGFAYSIQKRKEDMAARVVWEPEPIRNATAMFSQPNSAEPTLVGAMAWLVAQLATGPKRERLLKKRAKSSGMAWRTIQVAKAKLRVESHRRGGFAGAGHWCWSLPGALTPQKNGSAEVAPLARTRSRANRVTRKFVYVPRSIEDVMRRIHQGPD